MVDVEPEMAQPASEPAQVPKIELHVHLEGTVRPQTLLAIAQYSQLDRLGITAKQAYDAGIAGALCDEETMARLRSFWP